jgi:predicted NBD/HSP70 family sugar kinase
MGVGASGKRKPLRVVAHTSNESLDSSHDKSLALMQSAPRDHSRVVSSGFVNAAGNQGFLKTLNRNALLRLLYTQPGVSRAQLARLSRLTKMTVGALTQELIAEGWILEGDAPRSSSGRPGLPLRLNPNLICSLGAEIAVDYVAVVACDLFGNVIAERLSPLISSKKQTIAPLEALQMVAAGVSALRSDKALRGRRVLGLGVSVPGPVEADVLRFAPNLGWGETPVLQWLAPLLKGRGVQLSLENEANAAALGEYFFRLGEKPRSLVYLSLGVGVGCGIVIEGQVFHGAGGFAGEVGHTILYPPNGEAEAFVSQRALAGRLGYKGAAGMEAILKRADKEPEAVRAVGRDLGLLLANLVNTFSPDELVIGGPLSRLGEALLQPALETMRATCRWRSLEMVRVRLCEKRDRAAATGAAATVLHKLLSGSSRIAVE